MARSEFKLLYRIFAIAGTILVVAVVAGYIYLRVKSPHFFRFSDGLHVQTIELSLDSLSTDVFITGMNGCENLWLDDTSFRIYATDLSGHIFELNGKERHSLEIVRKTKVGNMAAGITVSAQDEIFAGVSEGSFDDWVSQGGYVIKLDTALQKRPWKEGPWPGLNGISFAENGLLYLTTNNSDPFRPEGKIFALDPDNPGQLKTIVPDAGIANGLWIDNDRRELYYSNTVEGIFKVSLDDLQVSPVYFKTSFFEFTDDICNDSQRNTWMTDPGISTVKVLIQSDSSLVRFNIRGFGQASSCRTRMEGGEEVIYITELNRKPGFRNTDYDGRGILSVRLSELYEFYEKQKAEE